MKHVMTVFYITVFLAFNTELYADDHKHSPPDDHHHKDAEHNDIVMVDQPHEDEHDHSDKAVSKIGDAMARRVGISVDHIGPQTLNISFTSYGRLTTSPERTSHVHARFPGIVRSVALNIGDSVKTGDLLAVIESNESLKRYDVRAPISGTIIQRHANAGEMTRDQVLFSISSFDSLWAELRIFPSQHTLLNINQPVSISAGERHYDTHIAYILPSDDHSPYLIARAKIEDNAEKWFPGLMVEGEIKVSEVIVPLAVKKTALQNLGGEIGIFIKEHNKYRFKPLILGRSDHEYSEVLSSVKAQTQYVVKNSYLIKADIEKSEAEHVH